jgi:pimeloyl-ACP methyl ester carboxylesterase
MPTTHVNGIDLWYELRGSSGPLLAISHGWRGPTADWPAGVIEALAERLRVLVYDVRGHGKTSEPADPASYTMPQYAADLRALLDTLDIDQAHIGGSSQGGMISAQFVVDYPERTRSLLLCDSTAGNGVDEGPGGQWERELQGHMTMMDDIVRTQGLRAFAEMSSQWDRRDPHFEDYPEPPELRDAANLRRHLRMTVDSFCGTARAIRERPDLTARIRELQAPALVLVGEWDGFRPCAERDHRLIEGSRFVLVRRSGHGVPSWRPDAFVASVVEFIADVEAGRDAAGEREL